MNLFFNVQVFHHFTPVSQYKKLPLQIEFWTSIKPRYIWRGKQLFRRRPRSSYKPNQKCKFAQVSARVERAGLVPISSCFIRAENANQQGWEDGILGRQVLQSVCLQWNSEPILVAERTEPTPRPPKASWWKTSTVLRTSHRFLAFELTACFVSMAFGREGNDWGGGDSSSIFFKALRMELNICSLIR